MAKKTVIRRIAVAAALSPETRDAVEKRRRDYIDDGGDVVGGGGQRHRLGEGEDGGPAQDIWLVIQDGTTPAVAETPGTGVRALRRAA